MFLCVVLSALVMLSFAMIWGAREHSVKSRSDAIINLAGDSVMSSFHREILTDYGLFMIENDGNALTGDLRAFALPSLHSMKNVRVSDAKVDGSRYCLVDPEPIRQQILSYMKTGGIRLLPGKKKADPESIGYHNLRHGPTIVSLPSRQLPQDDLWDVLGKLDRLKDLGDIFGEGTDRFVLGSYVLGTFNNCTGVADSDHFFHNEVEYILCGKLTDSENEKAITRSLTTLRFPSNLAHIYSDAEKTSALTAAAEAIAPGPAGLALKAALAAAWAYAESSNDAALLLEGKRVPVLKSPDSWALDLDSLMAFIAEGVLDPGRYGGSEEAGSNEAPVDGDDPSVDGNDPEAMLKKNRRVIHPQANKGLTYEQYLRILLYFRDDPATVMRILDLIQINIRKDYDGEFLIGEQSLGLSIEMKINGRMMSYDKVY